VTGTTRTERLDERHSVTSSPSWNPFQLPEHTAAPETSPWPVGKVRPVERTETEWGSWTVTAVLEGQYTSAMLVVRAGATLPLQHHVRLQKTITVHRGRVRVDFGPATSRLQSVELDAGEALTLGAHTVHRLTALVDSEVVQTSTAPSGWRQESILDPGPEAGS
jgi:mannose-6-phosphate isomerase